jgi:hypothetical protein
MPTLATAMVRLYQKVNFLHNWGLFKILDLIEYFPTPQTKDVIILIRVLTISRSHTIKTDKAILLTSVIQLTDEVLEVSCT